ncbi:MAG: nickel pincer cofactor biosynthesis protein LarC [Mahellales bacterium]|jgi:uncharacterized protein (TIGR00299 family) protein
MTILYLDCVSGVSGDMTLAALLDTGLVDMDYLKEQLKSLKIGPYHLEIKKTVKQGITGTAFSVVVGDHSHGHTTYGDIVRLIDNSGITPGAKEISKRIFARLAQAEARIHGVNIDRVTFHEVGAVDSIIDIVGVGICIDYLKINSIHCSPVHIGRGFVTCHHGSIPLPAPATLELLKGVPIYDTGIQKELVTPTGAAIISSLSKEYGNMPSMTVKAIGYGCGSHNLDIPNVFRVVVGESTEYTVCERITVLETNLDDVTGEVIGYTMDRLFEAGALEVYNTPVFMKKNRPGIKITVLCKDIDKGKIYDILFEETTTLGVREYTVKRIALDRKVITFKSGFGDVRVKLAVRDGTVIKASPEYEDCKIIAKRENLSLVEVYQNITLQFKKYLTTKGVLNILE